MSYFYIQYPNQDHWTKVYITRLSYTIPQPRPLDQGLYHKTIIYNTPTKTTGPRFISQDYLIIIYLNNIKYTLGEPFKKSYQEMSRIMRNELHLKSI